MSDPNPQPQRPVDPNLEKMLHEDENAAAAPPPKKKKRWWLQIIGAIVLLIIVLIVCAPYLASTAPVRSIVVSQINKNLAGSVAIDDYSLGWGGFNASGIKVYDDQKNLVAEITKIAVPVSLLGAARGNIDLGTTEITADKIDFRRYPDGTTSIDHLVKAPPQEPKTEEPKTEEQKQGAPKSADQPIELPKVKGRITINLVGGKISGEGVPAPIAIDP